MSNSSYTSSFEMKKFLFKILIAISLVAVTLSVIKAYVPFWWGDRFFGIKYTHMMRDKYEYNAAFMGSSKVFRHFNPVLFDSISSSLKIKSINLGTSGTVFPETFYQYKHMADLGISKLDYLFIEFSTPVYIYGENQIEALKKRYWLDLEETEFVLKGLRFVNNKDKEEFIIKETVDSYINNLLGIGCFEKYISALRKDGFKRGKKFTGFQPLNVDKKDNIRNIDVRYERKMQQAWLVDHFVPGNLKIPELTDNCSAIIENASKQGVHVIFVLNTSYIDYESIINEFYALPPEHRINMASPSRFPVLYDYYLFVDGIIHYNKKGADIYTELFADEFLRHVEKYKLQK